MNGYLLFVLCLLVFNYLLNLLVELLNLKEVRTEIPDEYTGYYDEEKYAKSSAT